jgi:4-diphosphocytidyl-2-C-methyl-D-erythritol kinase
MRRIMAIISEIAPAKINLTLDVLGRRPDGFHEIESLTAFASIGDSLTLDTEGTVGLRVSGPFKDAIDGPNLVTRAAERLAGQWPHLNLGAVHLEKCIPVAAGLGGGSADAAAFLRAVRRANPGVSGIDWLEIAAALGSDVPVCLEARAAWMSGRGEILTPLATALPAVFAVLVNPMCPVPTDKTASVFTRLGAPVCSDAEGLRRASRPLLARADDLITLMRAKPNALEAAAVGVVPEIAAVLSALEACNEVEAVSLSGAGPTCFGIFAGREIAAEAARTLTSRHPDWWVESCKLS